jgi:hypothetical protein
VELQSLTAPSGARLSLTGRRRRRLGRRGVLILVAMLIACVAAPAAAQAYTPPGQPAPASAPPGTPVLVPSMSQAPAGYRLTGNQVLADAEGSAYVQGQLKKMTSLHLVPYVYTRGNGVWQVSWFTPPSTKQNGPTQLEEIQVYVVDQTGAVSQVWTGYQVAWTMARGYPGAFGRVVNHLWIWLPLCALFLAPFIPWRRRPTLLHLDLLVLLGFSVSLGFFNKSNLGISVPLIYPFMIYLMVRLTLLAFGIGRPREPLRVVIPTPWLALIIIFLMAFRIGVNATQSNVIDVGYAGTIGGWKILHGQKLYGDPSGVCADAATSTDLCWPDANGAGDTYGPINYFAYAPFVAALGWDQVWDAGNTFSSLPASHAASIAFDVLTMIGLFFLGRRIRGPSFGVILSYLWTAYPFTLYALSSNSNDSLVALMVVASLLVVSSPPARGVMAAFAGLTKFGPFVLAPLMLRGTGTWPSWTEAAFWRRVALFAIPFGLAVLLPMLIVILNGDLTFFYDDTIKYQATRPAPFSVWGLWGDTFGGVTSKLAAEQHIWQVLTVVFGFAVMFFPRGHRNLVQVAALGGALMIAVEACLSYWFYLYIPWFFPLVIVAIVLAHPGQVVNLLGPEPDWGYRDLYVGPTVAGPGPPAPSPDPVRASG